MEKARSSDGWFLTTTGSRIMAPRGRSRGELQAARRGLWSAIGIACVPAVKFAGRNAQRLARAAWVWRADAPRTCRHRAEGWPIRWPPRPLVCAPFCPHLAPPRSQRLSAGSEVGVAAGEPGLALARIGGAPVVGVSFAGVCGRGWGTARHRAEGFSPHGTAAPATRGAVDHRLLPGADPGMWRVVRCSVFLDFPGGVG